MASPSATWRVYLREWLIVYTSDAAGPEGVDECWDHFAGKYKGRVRDQDRQVAATSSDRPGAYPYRLELRLPNLKGEYKDEADAVLLSAEHAGIEEQPRVVRRGSPEEQELLGYGRKMLPAAGTDVSTGKEGS